MLDLFEELVHFTRVFPHPRLTLEVVLVEIEEWRYPGHGRRRRWRRERSSRSKTSGCWQCSASSSFTRRPTSAACCRRSCRRRFTRATLPKGSASSAGSPSEWRTACAKRARSKRSAKQRGAWLYQAHREDASRRAAVAFGELGTSTLGASASQLFHRSCPNCRWPLICLVMGDDVQITIQALAAAAADRRADRRHGQLSCPTTSSPTRPWRRSVATPIGSFSGPASASGGTRRPRCPPATWPWPPPSAASRRPDVDRGRDRPAWCWPRSRPTICCRPPPPPCRIGSASIARRWTCRPPAPDSCTRW